MDQKEPAGWREKANNALRDMRGRHGRELLRESLMTVRADHQSHVDEPIPGEDPSEDSDESQSKASPQHDSPSGLPRQTHRGLSSISLPGLRASLMGRLDALTRDTAPSKLHMVAEANARTLREIDGATRNMRADRRHLNAETRNIRAWMAYFSRIQNLQACAAAISRARPVFTPVVRGSHKYSLPVLVHIRVIMKGRFRLQRYVNCTVVSLPVPMIAFDARGYCLLAEAMFHHRKVQREIKARTRGRQYQHIEAEIERLVGGPVRKM